MNKHYSIIVLLAFIGFQSCEEKRTNIDKEIEESIEIKSEEQQLVFNEIKALDSILFKLGYNQCDTNQLKLITSDDFEFYHDQHGIMDSKSTFVQAMSGLCNMDYKATRELDATSFKVHLLKNNGKLYGAIQTGKHSFYGEKKGKPKYLTSTADFTNLWIKENEDWKLKRVLSYNHVVPNEK